MKYKITATSAFKKELKIIKKRNKNLEKMKEVVDILSNSKKIDEKYKDHQLINTSDLKIAENAILNPIGY